MADEPTNTNNPPTTTPETNNTQPRRTSSSTPQAAKLWDAFGSPEERANALPGQSGPTATPPPKDLTVSDAMKSLSLENASSFYKMPCARDSLMLGIGAGFGVGGVRGVLGGLRSMWTACNWAVGAFAITALAAHEFCQRRRLQELDGMKQAMELMQQLKVKKQKEKEVKAAEVARAAEEERLRKSWTNLSNYKFW
ncbi:uncharacterized protein BDW47DRAFT_107300 [Aspergillus candidus]|uniref:Cytochrome c oxidase assembly protein COX20, mitochondrial n=1 Tax=Aspergillus candidus TaxID=41067 RepID=A0A2I2F9P4_ASPCN|nr:hypothetical protein BDW47DRAFT_107300 [Aspergillus candidus]PLB37325.1 hypothetical protein BDW47DRAFT_107300 [Aspergillus candidus]